MDEMSGGMAMSFFFNSSATDLLFHGWNIHTKAEFALSCLLFAAVAIVLEVIATGATYLTQLYATNPLDMNWMSSINARSPLLAPLQIPSSVSKVKQRRCRIHFCRTIVHIFHVAIGYMVMLVVMTYNAYFLISVALGSGAGYFMFAPFRRRPKKKRQTADRRADRSAEQDSLTRSGRGDEGTGGDQGQERSTADVNYYGSI